MTPKVLSCKLVFVEAKRTKFRPEGKNHLEFSLKVKFYQSLEYLAAKKMILHLIEHRDLLLQLQVGNSK